MFSSPRALVRFNCQPGRASRRVRAGTADALRRPLRYPRIFLGEQRACVRRRADGALQRAAMAADGRCRDRGSVWTRGSPPSWRAVDEAERARRPAAAGRCPLGPASTRLWHCSLPPTSRVHPSGGGEAIARARACGFEVSPQTADCLLLAEAAVADHAATDSEPEP